MSYPLRHLRRLARWAREAQAEWERVRKHVAADGAYVLVAWMEDRELGVRAAARELDCSPTYISRVASGKEPLSVGMLLRMADTVAPAASTKKPSVRWT